MANEKLARRYAQAVFSLAQESGVSERVGTDLRDIAGSLNADRDVTRFFEAPVVAREDKERVLADTFRSRVHTIALHALLLVVRKRREPEFGEIVDEYEKLEQLARGSEPLTVASAAELSPEELRLLVERLERLYGKQFEATQHVDPSLIGGVRVTIGDRRFDGTVAGRFDELSRTLFSGN